MEGTGRQARFDGDGDNDGDVDLPSPEIGRNQRHRQTGARPALASACAGTGNTNDIWYLGTYPLEVSIATGAYVYVNQPFGDRKSLMNREAYLPTPAGSRDRSEKEPALSLALSPKALVSFIVTPLILLSPSP
ncbi:uncharacterized protein RAG0_02717 [Rhynchosporium agropyri]|uniref:Uncharacterized protein n=1 Tax=Rhynchosporium agropyri TaxID=914238 RepID=A0A1E1K2N5_9HELO|nr:uncharacterized protein RAG0_02717 [Rhynchosporium agropyri]